MRVTSTRHLIIAEAIRAAHAARKSIGICGQAPSDFPEFAEWLVGLGIDSISLNPDTAIKTALRIAAAEQRKPVLVTTGTLQKTG
jgi:pyruvate, water dikinase